ncbi:hypothetical protein MHK_009584 [Candidatus Magnetomorum sp. HK-1]|nr:hypothetical protein MHK_009584 [Candidatus Magnetomorum sp. HK-1]
MSELLEKGENIYSRMVFPELDTEMLKGKIVAIEVESKDFFIEDTVLKAIMSGRKKYPKQRFYCKRIGYNSVYSHKGYVPLKNMEHK